MISVVVLHCNKAAYSRACLDSLLLSSSRPLEIINVDNGSHDETAKLLEEFSERARHAGIETQTLTFETNIGAIRGRNEAVKTARGEFLVFLDNDTVIARRDWLEPLQQFLEAHPQCAAVAPKLLFPWAPFDIECCGAAVSKRGRIQYIGRGGSRESLTGPFQIQCAISAAWMMPRAAWDAVGELDEIYSPVQYEDLDWCYRARALSWEIWALPSVEVFHFEHTTTAGSGDINFAYVTSKNAIEWKRRWRAMFTGEDGPSEDAAMWRDLPRRKIEEVDVAPLMPE